MERFLLNKEDSVAGFLSILFEKQTNKKGHTKQIKLTQTGLIQMILEATGMEECAPMSTPTDLKTLAKDKQGDPQWKDGAMHLLWGC